MGDKMDFTDTVEEFMKQCKVVDTDGVYMSKSKWSQLVPIFHMWQWFEELLSSQPEVIRCKDCKRFEPYANGRQGFCNEEWRVCMNDDFCSWAERKEGEQE